MRTITTLAFVFISTFSLFSQTIKKEIDFCRIIGKQDSVMYYVSYMKMGKDSINVFIKSDNFLEHLGRPSPDKEVNQVWGDFLHVELQSPIIEFNGTILPLHISDFERTCYPSFIVYKKKKNKTFVNVRLSNFSYTTIGNFNYLIFLTFEDDKLIDKKVKIKQFSEYKQNDNIEF